MDQTVINLFLASNPTNRLDPGPNIILTGINLDGPNTPHYGPANAVAVTEYPYGRLRCIMRFWLEYKKGKGTRLVSQTNNPKRPGLVWNNPHASTYTDGIVVLYTDEIGHVTRTDFTHYNLWSTTPQTLVALEAFEKRYGDAFTETDRAYMVKFKNYVSTRLIELATPHTKTASDTTCRTCKNYYSDCTGSDVASAPDLSGVGESVRSTNDSV